MESTIKNYQKTETSELQKMLKKFEEDSEYYEIIKTDRIRNRENYTDIQEVIDDYDIDISLIRMELNKRLWNES